LWRSTSTTGGGGVRRRVTMLRVHCSPGRRQ
jgi:hypothetical protein